MFDILPFPNITSTDPKEQIAQMNNYLIQLKEELEFILTNISADNLSPELRDRLNSLGAGIQTTEERREEVTQQVRNQSITVSDVINSPLFESAIDGVTEDCKASIELLESTIDGVAKNCITSISINYDTGNLEYEKGGTT